MNGFDLGYDYTDDSMSISPNVLYSTFTCFITPNQMDIT